ncbi:MAG: tetratricopeptide repeat protein [Pseudomonadota bacterium]
MKTLSATAILLVLAGGAGAQSLTAEAERAVQIQDLLAELAIPGAATAEAVEQRIVRLWSQSGSDTADLLLERGREALEAEDYVLAAEHLTALTDHAPEFAEGWASRAQVWFGMQEYGLAVDDLLRALSLNPDHFGAFTGLGVIYEDLGDYSLALRAIEEAHRLNPNSENVTETRDRLRRLSGTSTL